MGRSGNKTSTTLRPKRSLSSSEAREKLPSLVKDACAVTTPAKNLATHAVEIGPYNRGGAWLVPAADAQAAIERQESLLEQVAELEELIEDLTAAPVIAARSHTPPEKWETLDDFAAELGLVDVLEEARAELQ